MPEIHSDKQITAVNNLILEQRKKLALSGVTDIESFEDDNVLLKTTLGSLTVRGGNMKMGSYNADTGDLTVNGEIYALVYTDNSSSKEGFLSRIFK